MGLGKSTSRLAVPDARKGYLARGRREVANARDRESRRLTRGIAADLTRKGWRGERGWLMS